MDLAFDAFAVRHGVAGEDVSFVRSARVGAFVGDVISQSMVDRLADDRASVDWAQENPLDRQRMVDRGWFTPCGQLTGMGRALNADLGNARMTGAMFRSAAGVVGRGHLVIGAHQTLAVALPEPRGMDWAHDWAVAQRRPSPPVRFAVVDSSAVPLILARWGGLAPCWSFPSKHEPIPMSLVLERLADPRVPPPPQADDALMAMWTQPWVQWGFSTDHGDLNMHYIDARERGQFVVRLVGDARVRLVARPSPLVWSDLLQAFAARARMVHEADSGSLTAGRRSMGSAGYR